MFKVFIHVKMSDRDEGSYNDNGNGVIADNGRICE